MNTLITVLVVLVMLAAMFVVIYMLRAKTYKGDDKSLGYKEGLPVLPRDQRNVQDFSAPTDTPTQTIREEPDALSNLAAVAQMGSSEDNTRVATPQDTQQKENTVNMSNEFTQNSPILDRYLDKERNFDQNNDPLLHAKDAITLFISPRNNAVGLSGREVLEIARIYGLKYGVKNMYHRYENEDGSGDLWFSMLGVGRDGMQDFDLNTLTDQKFRGLSLFLSLPHPHALRGYDTMVATARLVAKDLNADIHDEEGYVFDNDYFDKLRLQVQNYQ